MAASTDRPEPVVLRRRLAHPLGICRLAWKGDVRVAASEARELGFAHLDIVEGDDPVGLEIGVGVRFASRIASGTVSTTPLPTADWGRYVARLRAATDPVVEPWAGSLINSDDDAMRLLEAVPGLRLVVDTGHVRQWGGDVHRLLPHAAHVQLRQARPGVGQLPVSEGDIDFASVIDHLEQLGFDGLLSVEYFDLPRMGWPLDDPVRHAVELAEHVRPLLVRRRSRRAGSL